MIQIIFARIINQTYPIYTIKPYIITLILQIISPYIIISSFILIIIILKVIFLLLVDSI